MALLLNSKAIAQGGIRSVTLCNPYFQSATHQSLLKSHFKAFSGRTKTAEPSATELVETTKS